MIGSKVVNLLFEHTCPEVFTDELHDVQLVFEPYCVLCQSRGRKYLFNTHKLVTAGHYDFIQKFVKHEETVHLLRTIFRAGLINIWYSREYFGSERVYVKLSQN